MSTSYSVNAVKIKKPTKRMLANVFRSLANAVRSNRIRRNNGLPAHEDMVQKIVFNHLGYRLSQGLVQSSSHQDLMNTIESYIWCEVNESGKSKRPGHSGGLLLNTGMLLGELEVERACRKIADGLDHGRSVKNLESILKLGGYTW